MHHSHGHAEFSGPLQHLCICAASGLTQHRDPAAVSGHKRKRKRRKTRKRRKRKRKKDKKKKKKKRKKKMKRRKNRRRKKRKKKMKMKKRKKKTKKKKKHVTIIKRGLVTCVFDAQRLELLRVHWVRGPFTKHQGL
uniref:Uncharacterized protein n=1 Tax=Knipowitschia caucasica TaxID=637954 RepID=A0AAV2MMP0_KNICA